MRMLRLGNAARGLALAGLACAGLASRPLPLLAADGTAKPVWEAGIGAGGGWIPDYPAAGQNHAQALPLPYVIYRGDVVRLGDGGLARGLLFGNKRVEFDFSLSGSFPVDSGDNEAREGLPDLDWLGEIGPRLSIYLYRPSEDADLRVDLQGRAVLSTDFSSFGYEGVVFNPVLAWRQELRPYSDNPMKLAVHLGSTIGDQRLMRYFYEVDEKFATPERQAFDAKGGYLGSYLTGAFIVEASDRVKMTVGGSFAYFGGAANEDSPLFLDTTSFAAFTGLIWSFYQSDKKTSVASY